MGFEKCDCPAADLLRDELTRRGLFATQPERTTLSEFVEKTLTPGEYSTATFEATQLHSGNRECKFGVYRENRGWAYGTTPEEALLNAQKLAVPDNSVAESRATITALGDLPELPAPERAA
jgi:hypothetical protein